MLPAIHASLGATGQAYYRETVEKLVRKKLNESSPPGPVHEGDEGSWTSAKPPSLRKVLQPTCKSRKTNNPHKLYSVRYNPR